MSSSSSLYTILTEVYDATNHALKVVLNMVHTHQSAAQGATIDHGLAITAASLLDDDHTQYQKESEKGAASGYASLTAGTLVTENPANATATPTASKIPIADADGRLDGWLSAGATMAIIVSDDLRNSNDTEKSKTGASYVKAKETKLNAGLAAVRIKFDLKSGSADNAYGTIYKNGAAVGTERMVTGTTYETFSQDFSSLVTDNLIQIYVANKDNAVASSYVRNFRLYYVRAVTVFGTDTLTTSLPTTTDPTISVTNQDPA